MTSPIALAAASLMVVMAGGINQDSAAETEAVALRACGEYGQLRGMLEDRYGERQASSGVAEDGSMLQLFASTSADTWTMITVAPRGWACVVAVGRNWQEMLNLAQGQPV